MEFATNTVFVTGAAGWLGKGLVNALANGLPDVPNLAKADESLNIFALVLPSEDDAALRKISPRAQIVRGDVRDAADCRRFLDKSEGATIFHCAGLIHPKRIRDLYQVNVEGTANVLNAAAAAGARRAIIVSSNSPCGNNPHPDHLFDEQSPYNPYMNYGRSKMQMELRVKAIGDSGKLETVIIRAPWFYGPFQPPRQTLFFEMIRDGKAPIVGGGNGLRSMAYVDNLAQGLILAALTPAANGKTYWVADERPYSMNEIVDTVERLLEKEFSIPCAHKRMRLPGFASDVAQVMDATIQSLGFYQQKIHVLSEMNKTIACSVKGAMAELNYRPAIALEEGMRRSIRWCFEQGLMKASA
jgi:nucleoside-diphosphate-sugar epimerase